jgi:hypothetical protein
VATVRDYASAHGIDVLIETGTFRGAMIHAQLAHFQLIYSIEIDRALYSTAVRLFRRHQHVHLVLGDSSDALPHVLSEVRQPSIFWLDGHYSGGTTGRGAFDSPIAKELAHIWGHDRLEHVILIDDARHFIGQGGYPTIQELGDIVRLHRPAWVCEVKDDIIRIHRPLVTPRVSSRSP